MKIKPAAKQALMIASMCFFSYLSVYVAKNVLGAVSPEMIEKGILTTENIGSLSSIYFITYAVGQLINGKIGDKIKAKYMISFGLIFAGICNFIFVSFINSLAMAYISYAAMGFFLSMIYGPMTKTVAENTEPKYTTRCALGYTFASFLASPIAGVLASVIIWKYVLTTSYTLLIIMGIICFIAFSVFDRKGIIQYGKYKKIQEKGNIKVLLKHKIVKFMAIAMITGVVRTTVVFWMPIYISQYLGFTTQKSTLIFSIATFAISMTAPLAVFLYERLGSNMDLTIRLAFTSATVFFFMVFLFKIPTVNIVFLVLAIMMSGVAASMTFSRYCPGLRDTGMVSTATGIIDFSSYMAAAISSKIFANAVEQIGWGNLILVWLSLMIIGVIISLPFDKIIRRG